MRAPLKMRQSLAAYEQFFDDEAEKSQLRRQQLLRQVGTRAHSRRIQRVHTQGTLRFIGLCLAIIATTVIVAVATFQALILMTG